MPTSYTSLLGLALPVTGELSGTWGDTVNDYITQYVDAAAAGTQTISGSQTAVTLTVTNGTSLTQVGSGSSGSAQYAVINCTGNPAGALTVTVPSSSRAYLVLNNTSTSQTVTVKGAATTGVAVAAARAALIAWNGSDYELVATDDASKMNGILAVANGGTGQTSLTANYALFGNGTSGVNASSLLQIVSSYIRPTAYADTVVAAGNTGTALTLTCTNGNVFTATLTGNATITLSSPVGSGSSTSITLILTNDGTAGRTVAWAGGSFVFPGGAASLSRTTTANAVDVWVFFTPNGGTTWYGNIAMKNMTA
jgi:hypothetical protein